MKKYIFGWAAALTTFCVAHAAQPLTLDRIYGSPDIEGVVPKELKFAPNGSRLSFLRPKDDNFEVLDLWEFDLKTGKAHLLVDSQSLQQGELSEAEKARRERMRITTSGIVEYHWSHDAGKIAFPAGNDIYLHEFGRKLRRLTRDAGAELDVQFSPKDRFVSYVRDQNLWVLELATGKEHAVTSEGRGDVSYGIAEFIAQEEMDRYTGYWWSANEEWLAFTRVDESPVKWVERYEINASSVTVRKQRYPEVGSANARVDLFIVKVADVLKGNPKAHPVAFEGEDVYLPRVEWTRDGRLAFQVQSRNQKALDLFAYDPIKSKTHRLLREQDPHWVDLNNDWHWLKNGQFIWASEKSGFKHLYLHERNGKLIRQLTSGDWPVDQLTGVDEEGEWVYFSAGMKTPLESHHYRVSLKTAAPPQDLTQEMGFHRPRMDKLAQYFVDEFSTPLTPTQIRLHKADGTLVATLSQNEVKKGHPLFDFALIAPEFGTFKNAAGVEIHYSLMKPPGFDPQKKYPLVVLGYGGPGVQVVHRGWPGKKGLFAQVLLQQGFMVASFDNRGSARRGRAFENALYHAMGTVEVEDQRAGVRHLMKTLPIDSQHVGFFGWSYGGYLALMLSTKAADTFKAVVAVAPVTDFRLYDTHYTERFMGTPHEDPKAYEEANVLNYVEKLKGHVLVAHGMADDNVLFTNSTMLFKKLQDLGIIYESLTYPGSKHGLTGRTNQLHVRSSIVDFFNRRLK